MLVEVNVKQVALHLREEEESGRQKRVVTIALWLVTCNFAVSSIFPYLVAATDDDDDDDDPLLAGKRTNSRVQSNGTSERLAPLGRLPCATNANRERATLAQVQVEVGL